MSFVVAVSEKCRKSMPLNTCTLFHLFSPPSDPSAIRPVRLNDWLWLCTGERTKHDRRGGKRHGHELLNVVSRSIAYVRVFLLQRLLKERNGSGQHFVEPDLLDGE